MNLVCRVLSLFLVSAGLFIYAGAGIAQQAYPTKPIRFVLINPPGGALDLVARLTGNAAAERLGQPLIYDHRPGANTIVATDICAKSAPDGYTLCLITSNLSMNQYLYSKLPYNSIKDIDPVTNLVFLIEGLFMNNSVPANSLRELVAYSKANPGKINFGSVGNGSSGHLVPEWIMKHTSASFTHIPYKGFPALMQAFTVGEIHLMFFGLGNPNFVDNIKNGKMKALFLTQRVPLFPDVPTMSEAGVPDHGFRIWWGLGVPAGTPKDIIGKLNAAFVGALRTPGVRERLAKLGGIEPVGNTPEEFGKFLAEDRARGERLVKASGVRLD